MIERASVDTEYSENTNGWLLSTEKHQKEMASLLQRISSMRDQKGMWYGDADDCERDNSNLSRIIIRFDKASNQAYLD